MELLSRQEMALRPADRADLDLLVYPTVYQLDLTLNLDGPQLDGRADILYTNSEETNLTELYLRLYPNMNIDAGGSTEIGRLTVDGKEVEPQYELQRTALRVGLEPSLPPGAAVEVSLEFDVRVPLGAGGNYGAFASQRGVLALAHFYPFVPVYDDEGWNVELAPTFGDVIYSDMSLYDVTLVVPDDVVVVATGSGLPLTVHDDGTITYRFVSGPARDFNIVLSHAFQATRAEVDGITVNCYYLPGDEDGGEMVLDVASEALRIFNRRFGRYPYAELDVVPTFTSAAGIEYPGLIVIAQRLYAGSDRSEWVVAHEVAHQWWYNMVGNDQVDEPWLDEALTQYATILYFEDRYGPAVAERASRAGLWDRWQKALDEGRDRPVVGPVASFAPEDYGPIVYGKGPLFFHYLRQEVGDAAFDNILRTYFQEHRYRIATAESLLAVAERLGGRNLDALYQQWILQ
jgi:aminopeptidase N